MNPQRIAIKLFVRPDPSADIDLDPFTPLFHEFIQKSTVPGLLVDVADYAHVPRGPGIILIGHDVDYGLDSVGGRAGLLVVRKRYGQSTLADILQDTLARGFACAKAIEDDGRTGVAFSPAAVELQIFDRLVAPNDAGTFEAMKAEVEPVFAALYGECSIERAGDGDPRAPAALIARTDRAPGYDDALAKLGGSR